MMFFILSFTIVFDIVSPEMNMPTNTDLSVEGFFFLVYISTIVKTIVITILIDTRHIRMW